MKSRVSELERLHVLKQTEIERNERLQREMDELNKSRVIISLVLDTEKAEFDRRDQFNRLVAIGKQYGYFGVAKVDLMEYHLTTRQYRAIFSLDNRDAYSQTAELLSRLASGGSLTNSEWYDMYALSLDSHLRNPKKVQTVGGLNIMKPESAARLVSTSRAAQPGRSDYTEARHQPVVNSDPHFVDEEYLSVTDRVARAYVRFLGVVTRVRDWMKTIEW